MYELKLVPSKLSHYHFLRGTLIPFGIAMVTAPPVAKLNPAMAASESRAATRMVSLDVFRGLIVMGMVLVTNAGDWNHVYWPLKHADWNGVTPTDMIFPSFLFICGISMTFSFAARRRRGATSGELAKHVAIRSALLVVVGLFLNGFPLFDWHNLRIPGVLQRIGLCYLGAGLFYLVLMRKQEQPKNNARALVGAMVALLAGYWALMKLVPVPGYGAGRLDQFGSLEAYIDRTVFGTNHLWFYGGQTWDPEGILSTLPATANVLLGLWCGEWLRRWDRKDGRLLFWLAFVGIIFVNVGVALNHWIPINKKIWTPSFVLFSGGFSLLALALLSWLIDVRKWRWGLTPALIYGTNAILAFALANMLNPLEGLVHIGGASSIHALIDGWLAQWLSPYNASLGYAILFVLANMAIAWPFYRKRVFLKL